MYSESVVQASIEKIEKASREEGRPLTLVRYERPQIEEMVEHLTGVFQQGSKRRPWTEEELAFIENEQIMCKVDFHYWAERYAHLIKDAGEGLGVIDLWESQKQLLLHISKLEEECVAAYERDEPVEGILIALNKARQLGACLTAGTRVLRGDLRWVPIEEIRQGDTLVAFDEDTPRAGNGRELRLAEVQAVCSMTAPTFRIELDDGTVFHGTPHHRFLCQTPGGTALKWMRLDEMQPGLKVRRVMEPWGPGGSFEDGWMGGMIDGEGSCRQKHHGGSELSVSQTEGDVLDTAREYLHIRGYGAREERDERKAGTRSKLGRKVVVKLVVNRLRNIFRLIGQTRPRRFLSSAVWWEGKEMPKDNCSYATVVSAEPSFDQTVYDLQTSTRTYIAEGFASHNTMICRMIIIHRLTLWDHSRSLSASVDEDKVLELYNRDKRILDNLPFYLVPAVSWSKHWKPDFGFDKKGEHMAFQAIDSSILYQHSKQQSGLGQGRQFDISHITEVASFPYPRMLEHDFFPTIPWSRWAFCVMESTPQGRGDWWHEWSEKVRHDRIPRWHYLFVPVYVERKKYRAQAPEDWSPSALTTQYARKVEETSPRVVGYQFHPDRNHLYWWETTRQAYAESNALTIFLTNYAATPEESFQFSTGAAIRPEVIQQLRMYESEPVSYEFTRS